MSSMKSLKTKLKPVKKGKRKSDKVNIFDSREVKELVEKVATQISNEVVYNTVRKAIASTDFTSDMINVTVRKAVQSSELLKKYPALPENIRKLAEPTKATYIALYNKHRNVLRPKTIGSVKGKIAEYLQKIEEISLQNLLEKTAEKESRVKRKKELIEIKKKKEFANFCDEKCDEIFNLFLNKFTETFKPEREIPKPLILGQSSLKLYESIQEQFTNLISPPKTAEPMTTVSESVKPTVKKLMKAGETPKQTLDNKNTTDLHNSRKTPEKMMFTGTDVAAVVEKSVLETVDVETSKEITETKEIVDRLSYFIMEFIQNSLVEAV